MKKQYLIRNRITVLIVLIALSFSVMAQKGEDEVESKTDVWKAEVESLCETYSVAEKAKSNLSKAYVVIRQEVEEDNKKISKQNDSEAYDANAEKNKASGRIKLQKEIEKELNDEQAAEALLVLGNFSSRWDSYQKVLLDLNLNTENLSNASKSLANYMKVYLKARKIAADAGDRFSGRTATELKGNLDKAMESILDENQMSEWATATQRKQRSN